MCHIYTINSRGPAADPGEQQPDNDYLSSLILSPFTGE